MPVSQSIPRQTLFRVLCLAGLWLLIFMTTGHVHAQTLQRAVLARATPEYPALALRMHISGTVQVHVVVEPNGTVSHVQATSGHAFLQGPAEEAVRRWKFAKAPAATELNVEVQFAPDPRS